MLITNREERQKMNKFICGIWGDYCSEYTYNKEKDADECNNCKVEKIKREKS